MTPILTKLTVCCGKVVQWKITVRQFRIVTERSRIWKSLVKNKTITLHFCDLGWITNCLLCKGPCSTLQIHFLFHLDYCNNLLTGSNLAAFPSLCCQSGSCRHFWSELSCFKPFRTNIGVIKGECTRIRSVALFITQDRLGRKGARLIHGGYG